MFQTISRHSSRAFSSFLRNLSSLSAPPNSTGKRHPSLSDYGFRFSLETLKPETKPSPEFQPRKLPKPPYRPTSSLNSSVSKSVHSDLHFDFRFSYTESDPSVRRPIGLREPKYSPFGPGNLGRRWTGVCATVFDPIVENVDGNEMEEVEKKAEKLAERARIRRLRVLGEPLSLVERNVLIERNLKIQTRRQINLGRDGLTHNMLDDIHNHWKHAQAVRIKCMGVPTVDMKNIYIELEDKTGGFIIYKHGAIIILYRGRYYNPKSRPVIPLMLWKPHEPIYPRLIKKTIEGLTIEETREIRKLGLKIPPLTKLEKNGFYNRLVPMVRDAFLEDELVRIDCKGLAKSDYRRIGMKLRDLVPCILVTFDKEQIVAWRGQNYKALHTDDEED